MCNCGTRILFTRILKSLVWEEGRLAGENIGDFCPIVFNCRWSSVASYEASYEVSYDVSYKVS
jgi:hypothetical protein